MAASCWPWVGYAQLHLVGDQPPQQVFAGNERAISLIFFNGGTANVESDIRAQLLQASSATVAMIDEMDWKHLQMLPSQTVIESAALDFPAVTAETRFIIRWLDGTRFIGATDVLVYPTNLLKDLKVLAGENCIGVFDPENELKPLLKDAGVEFDDLELREWDNFSGKLVVMGPFSARAQVRDGLIREVQSWVAKGIGVVWLQPPGKRDGLKPSFYSVAQGKVAVVVAQQELVSNLSESPSAQMNLVQLCQLALRPEAPLLPK